MSRLLDVGLEELTEILSRMGRAAKNIVRTSITGFMEGRDLKDQASELSEMLAAMTVSVEEKAFELIVKYQPVASDMRLINSYMKIAYDFERYGRYALDISSIQRKFSASRRCVYSEDIIEKIMEKAMQMVHASVHALRENDGEMAKSLAETEKEVDKLYSSYLDELSRAPSETRCIVCNALVVTYLERTADHAIYIGEEICYIATGKKIHLG